jgi:hypothetical protein
VNAPQQPWGGGGGLGPPPGGGGYGGGGNAPLGRIPFSQEDESNIRQTALFMQVAGGLAVLGALFGLFGSIGVNLYTGAPALGGVCFGTVVLSIEGLLATLLFLSANAFTKIVTTDGSDQQNLAEGLRKLRVYFLVKAALWVLGFLTCCCFLVIGITMGAAVFAALAPR